MFPTLLGAAEDEEGQSEVTILTSSISMEGIELKERNYMGLPGCSAVDCSAVSSVSDQSKRALNLKATELRLGLPGSQSPERHPEPTQSAAQLDKKSLFPLHPYNDAHYSPSQKAIVTGNKRGFSDAMDGIPEGKFVRNAEVNPVLSPRPNMGVKTKSALDNTKCTIIDEARSTQNGSTNSNAAASKAQVVGWPPIRSFRKNSLSTASKNNGEVDGEAANVEELYVKVSMDGAPFKRKVDLKNHLGYQDLSSTLEKKFSCFTLGQSNGALTTETLCESKLKDLLHGSEYVLTYEDKDGDWMLVGDVPWEMFIETCTKLRIMKGSDAIGLAPRAVEKCGNRN